MAKHRLSDFERKHKTHTGINPDGSMYTRWYSTLYLTSQADETTLPKLPNPK